MKFIKPLFKNKQLFFLIFLGLLLILMFISQIFLPKNITLRSKANETISLVFEPSSVTAANNADFTLIIKMAPTNPLTIQLFKINLNFDKSKVKIKEGGIVYSVGQPSSALGADDNSKINLINGDSGTAIIKLYGEITNPPEGLTANNGIELARVTFTSKTNTSYTITSSNSSVTKVNADYTVTSVQLSNATLSVNSAGGTTNTPTPTRTPTPTPTGGGSENVTLNLKIRFQGIAGLPANKTMRVRIKLGGSQSTNYQTATFTADQNGVWTGSVSFNTTPDQRFIVYVKGPKHIQKKVCDSTPNETAPGTYRCSSGKITLASGVNNLDFSGILLLAGDLPEQDGIVNSYDTSLIRNNLDKSDVGALSLADINLDGIVNTQDHSLIIAALSVRADEE